MFVSRSPTCPTDTEILFTYRVIDKAVSRCRAGSDTRVDEMRTWETGVEESKLVPLQWTARQSPRVPELLECGIGDFRIGMALPVGARHPLGTLL